jgi:hypothetical protein
MYYSKLVIAKVGGQMVFVLRILARGWIRGCRCIAPLAVGIRLSIEGVAAAQQTLSVLLPGPRYRKIIGIIRTRSTFSGPVSVAIIARLSRQPG